MLPPTGIPACPWECTVVGQQANGGICHPATVPTPQGASPRLWQPGVLAMGQSVAPSEGGQGWSRPHGHSRSTPWLWLVPPPFAFAASNWRLGPPRLHRGCPTASPSDPAGTGLIPCSFPPSASRVSPCPSHGFGAAKCIGGGLQACGGGSVARPHGPISPSPAGGLDWLPGSPGRGRQVWADQASIPELLLVSRQGAR